MSFKMLAAAAMVTAVALPAWAAGTGPLSFRTHADFFSTETGQNPLIDPQVFVADATAQAATGPQGIKHVAGFRPAKIQSAPGTTSLNNADGKQLGFTLGTWLGAKGDVTIVPAKASGSTITAKFHGLLPNAEYSLFENHFDQDPVGFTPLDGKGTKNSFRADAKGHPSITVASPDVPTSKNAILVVYHSDGKSHGSSRGEIGIGAQHQLIVRPAAG
jgi:hypothetical protein